MFRKAGSHLSFVNTVCFIGLTSHHQNVCLLYVILLYVIICYNIMSYILYLMYRISYLISPLTGSCHEMLDRAENLNNLSKLLLPNFYNQHRHTELQRQSVVIDVVNNYFII